MEHDNAKFLPSLAISSESLAKRTRRRRRLLVALRLILVTLAALFGALSFIGRYSTQRLDYAGVAGVLAFIGVLGIRLVMQSDPELEDAEPRGNAVGELVASHAWRYAIGARPYAIGSPELDRVAGRQFTDSMGRYQQILANYSITAPVSRQITDEMKRIRANDLSYRREIYIAERIEPLQAASSENCVRLAWRWRVLAALVLLVELIGIPGGVLKAIDVTRIDLLGVTAAAAASIALWVDTLNFQERRRIATAVGRNLVSAHDKLDEAKTEDEWAAVVGRIEAQLSLEAEALLSSDTATLPGDSQVDDIHAMSPAEYFAAAATLKRQIWDESDELPKLEPDVIVAVNPGGAILGGILYFMTRASDFMPLSFRGSLRDEDLENMLKAAPWQPRKQHLSVLLVDASVKSGSSLKKAMDLVREAIESKGFVPETGDDEGQSSVAPRYVLRTAVIAKKADPHQRHPVRVDYFVNETTERFPYGSI
jgi:SMODS and SLOG-associating 2TM effector domain 3/SMODS and SLOG-associating 2TM effector domain 1